MKKIISLLVALLTLAACSDTLNEGSSPSNKNGVEDGGITLTINLPDFTKEELTRAGEKGLTSLNAVAYDNDKNFLFNQKITSWEVVSNGYKVKVVGYDCIGVGDCVIVSGFPWGWRRPSRNDVILVKVNLKTDKFYYVRKKDIYLEEDKYRSIKLNFVKYEDIANFLKVYEDKIKYEFISTSKTLLIKSKENEFAESFSVKL